MFSFVVFADIVYLNAANRKSNESSALSCSSVSGLLYVYKTYSFCLDASET